jgi:hypothetical protein
MTFTKNTIDVVLGKLKTVLDNMFYVPDGSEFIIDNQNGANVIIRQDATPDGRYFLRVYVYYRGYGDSFVVYNVKMDNVPVGDSFATNERTIRIMKVSSEFINGSELVHIVVT